MTALELATTSALVDLWMLLKWQPVPQISLFGRVWIPCQSYYWRMCNRCRDLHQRAHIRIIGIVQDESHRCRDLSPNFNLMGEVPPTNWWHNGTMINATSAVQPDQSLVTFSIMCSILHSDPQLWKWKLTIWYGKGRNGIHLERSGLSLCGQYKCFTRLVWTNMVCNIFWIFSIALGFSPDTIKKVHKNKIIVW